MIRLQSLEYYLFKDPKPSNGRSTPIQKGLIPSRKGGEADLCEEGLGFGVPTLEYVRDFYFPGKSLASPSGIVNDSNATKTYWFDLIERRETEPSKIHILSWVQNRFLLRLYKYPISRKVLEILGSTVFRYNISKSQPPKFIHVNDRGYATTIYKIEKNKKQILVSVDLTSIKRKNLQRLYISNELSGRLFDYYIDSSNHRLFRDSIGGWDKIDASWAIFYAPSLKFGYRIDIPPAIIAYRGLETFNPSLCWSGVIFSLPATIQKIEYKITLGTLKDLQQRGAWNESLQ